MNTKNSLSVSDRLLSFSKLLSKKSRPSQNGSSVFIQHNAIKLLVTL
jgi:hypothetical protein